MYCRFCGKVLVEDAQFCYGCGRPVYREPIPPAGSSPLQPPAPSYPPPLQPTPSVPATPKEASHKIRNFAIVIAVILILALAVIGIATLGINQVQQVVVTGTVSTQFGTYPRSLSFASDSGRTYTTSVTRNGLSSTGNYSIVLPYGHYYTLTVTWVVGVSIPITIGGVTFEPQSTGTCNGGSFQLNTQGTFSYNASC